MLASPARITISRIANTINVVAHQNLYHMTMETLMQAGARARLTTVGITLAVQLGHARQERMGNLTVGVW